MRETQRLSMKRVTGTYREAIFNELFVFGEHRTLHNPITPIGIIIEQGMTYMLHMNPDLVCSAGFQFALHQRNVVEPFQYREMGDGFFAVIAVWKNIHDLS